MFKVAKKRVVKLPVVIPVTQDGGRVAKYEVEADFEILDQPDQDAIFAGGGTDADLLRRVVVGWPDSAFQEEDERPLLFNEDNKERLFRITSVRLAFVDAYVRASQGREAARKN